MVRNSMDTMFLFRIIPVRFRIKTTSTLGVQQHGHQPWTTLNLSPRSGTGSTHFMRRTCSRGVAFIVLSFIGLRFTSVRGLSMATRSAVQYVDAKQSRRIDERLMTSPGFTIDQLMELAGYSVAEASMDFITQVEERSDSPGKSILVLCGPGNNGGDGLVAARHLKHFGYEPSIVYPKRGKGVLFENLVQQMIDLRIPVFEAMQNPLDFNYAIDALFGFSFTGVPREPYASMIRTLSDSKIPVISVDIPSGWDVDHGDIHNTRFQPHAVVSLTAPKLCMRGYTGVHYVGGRFVPPAIAEELGITLPDYGFNSKQYVLLSSGKDAAIDTPAKSTPALDEPVSALFVTAPNIDEARRIAQELLQQRLVACVNLVPQVESMYVWEGKLETSQEVLMMIKTRRSLVPAVTEAVKGLHPYEVPETIALDVAQGNGDYLAWVRQSTAAAGVGGAGSGSGSGKQGTLQSTGTGSGMGGMGEMGKVDPVTGAVVTPAQPGAEAASTMKYTSDQTEW